ncbi:bifunctional 3'-5' exonuclease/DNA polymerase [Aquifex aeolicus]|uniref:DNA polymerase I n=1 Tax=Aquifex aeolicus (strain VF5) TaxID=224324 RepID=DPO1_AQUAE|nr:bifunctional 3'-5' exonuclease/DNA polymerase [Aquifex aeolicus]O67779.1 RecName: Full=DNA polymerase I; Short=POL I [Aquifex aeolicus VF5]AAC07735.1 DNA polymerase I (PolI) [Aquifex aeolicus VF5]
MDFEYVTGEEGLKKAIKRLENSPYLYLDTETTGDRIRLVQIGDEENTYVIDLYEIQDIEPLRKLINERGIVGHNLKFDLKYLYRYGIFPSATFDTMIASYLLGYERHSLNHIVSNLLGYSMDKSYQTSDWGASVLSDAQLKYAANDVIVLRELFPKMRDMLNELDAERGEELLKTRTAKIFDLKSPVAIVEMAFVREVAKLEINGFPVDVEELTNKLKAVERETQKRIQEFYIKYRVDPLSPKQLASLLTKKFKLNLPKTPKGNVSTDDKALTSYQDVEPVKLVLEIRKLKKIADKLKELKEHLKNGRVYPEFKQIGAVTGRMSSAHPNIQNIHRDMRGIFKAEEGNTFVISDFSQIELRIAAEYVKDPLMLDAFKKGKDMHRYTASVVLGKKEEEITKEERQLAKAINFGLIYGISAKGLAEYAKLGYGVEISLEEAQVLRERFFKNFKAFKEWHDRVKKELKEKGEVKGHTLLGRRFSANTFNDAVNYPIQGTGADLLKLAVLLFDANLQKKGIDAKLVNLVHDEIVVECEKEKAEEVKEILEKSMKTAGKIILKEVPVEVESVINERWTKD